MRILNEVYDIICDHDLKSIILPNNYKDVYAYLHNHPYDKNKFESIITDEYLYKKYKLNIPKGWYGFDIGTPIIPEWVRNC